MAQLSNQRVELSGVANAAILGMAAAVLTRAAGARYVVAVKPAPLMSVFEVGLLGYRARPVAAGAFVMARALEATCLTAFCYAAAYAFVASRLQTVLKRPLLFGAAVGAVYYELVNAGLEGLLGRPGDRGLWPMAVQVALFGVPMAITVSAALRRYHHAEI